MCGRYIANSEDEVMEIREILKQISIRLINPALSEIFPTNEVLIIKESETMQAKWGIEKWNKKGVIINARSETYENSGFFKTFADNRCIVPAHGYYEWQTLPDKKKIKYAFTSNDKHGIFIAGICKAREFAIITKPAEENIRFIHERMPLLIPVGQAVDWLNGGLSVKEVCGVDSGIVWEKAG